jgi:tetratricopeptide (TPR) repeat protein
MRLLWAFAASLALAGCAAGPKSLPELPPVPVERFIPGAREQVQKAYDEARANPNDGAACGRLGMVLHAYEQYESAAACYTRAWGLQPKEFRWPYLTGVTEAAAGKNIEAAESLRAALRIDRDYLPARLKLADVLLALGRLSESGEMFRELAAKHPDLAPAHYGAGRVRAAQGDLAGAVEHYRRACELVPHYAAARYGLALAYQKLGETAAAQQEMAAYRKDPLAGPVTPDPIADEAKALNQSATHHLKRGVSLEASGRLPEAIAEHEKAVSIDPKLLQAHMNLITLYAKAGNPAKAEERYRATVELNPNLAESHYNYGVMLFEQRRYPEAAAAFRKALEIQPGYVEARGNLAYILMVQGNLAEAERHYRTAVESQPGYRLGHFQLGRLLLNRGRLEEALHHFRLTLGEEGPSAAGYLYALGAACGRAGRRDESLTYLRQARDKAAAAGQTQLLASIERDLRIVEQRR